MGKEEEVVDENLGKLARDKVTGFEGVITVLGIHLYGCNTYVLTPKAKDGKLEDSRNFDQGRIEIIGEGVEPAEVQGSKPGCEIANLENKVA